MRINFDDLNDMIVKYPTFQPNQEVKNFVNAHLRGEIVESVNLEVFKDDNSFTYFTLARSKLGLVLPTLDWAKAMKKVICEGSVLEVAAGTGLVAKYLNLAGVNIKATDDFSYHKKYHLDWKLLYEVEELDYKDAIRKYKADYLLLCWALPDDPLAYEASKLFTELNSDGKIIVIAEWYGASGDDDFHEGAEIIDYLDEVNELYPKWKWLHDHCFLVKWRGKGWN